jgi:hypothetical protein
MDATTFSYWRGWKDARASFAPEPDEQAEPDAYRAGYEHGSESRVIDEVAALSLTPG